MSYQGNWDRVRTDFRNLERRLQDYSRADDEKRGDAAHQVSRVVTDLKNHLDMMMGDVN